MGMTQRCNPLVMAQRDGIPDASIFSSSVDAQSPVKTPTRRQAVRSLLGASVGAFGLLRAAHGAVPKEKNPQQGANARALKLSKGGEETEAFKENERKRKEAEARQASGQKAKEESVEEQMARLGLKTYK